MPTRRQALKTLLAAGAFTGLYTWRIEPHWLQFTYPALPIGGLPKQLAGKTLAQISDTHIGPQVNDDYIINSFRRTQELTPDFIVFTGDWISFRGHLAQFQNVIKHLPRGKLGTVGILGNHDYGFRWSQTSVADAVTEIARDAGVLMLRNESTTIAGLRFVGLDDLWGPFFQPESILAKTGAGEATIVLSHNPDAADRPVWGDYKGWILAGHTHGGQCKPPFLPPPELPVKNRLYTRGEFALSGNRRMYISRGVGHLLRVRFNVRPEIPIFRLQSA
jgi:predicted MPP superfamily phosphohydrolase